MRYAWVAYPDLLPCITELSLEGDGTHLVKTTGPGLTCSGLTDQYQFAQSHIKSLYDFPLNNLSGGAISTNRVIYWGLLISPPASGSSFYWKPICSKQKLFILGSGFSDTLFMTAEMQRGIYYGREPKIGNSMGLLFLRARQGTEADEIGRVLDELWRIFSDLERGIVRGMDFNPYKRYSGNLSVLVGYGSEIFSLSGIRKEIPSGLQNTGLFNPPQLAGGGYIMDNSRIRYSDSVRENHANHDHIIFQFIAENEFFTNRAASEVAKFMRRIARKGSEPPIKISKFYTGFQSPNMRNWLGFLDGVSNMRSDERKHAIAIHGQSLRPQDSWLINGCYMAFLRILLDMDMWEDTEVRDQEIMIGRDKETGCPLIGVDENNEPVIDSRCPVLGTIEVTDDGNEYFRDHLPYGKQILPSNVSDQILKNSHIGKSMPTAPSSQPSYFYGRIFRQGFEFLDPFFEDDKVNVGLNFISFQNNLHSLNHLLGGGPLEKSIGYAPSKSPASFESIQSVVSAGVFLVPPFRQGEVFPGSCLFIP